VAFTAQSERACDPAAVLTGLNEALCGKFQGRYVTAAYALIDTGNQTLRYAGAGHPPLLLREQQSGNTRRLLENGLFLGYFPNAKYTAVETHFHPGDWVLLYTDGISETRNASDEQFGDVRLRAFLLEHPDLAADDFADRLLDQVAIFRGRGEGQDPEDDITLLAIHFQAGV
jgi:serine phosphatase RsbU (regulator of sigma subunit)